MSFIPPPPPAPVRAQGPPPGVMPPMPANFHPQGQPGGPAPRAGPPQQNQQFPNSGKPAIISSSRIVDVTQPIKLDEAACRKKFTTYAVYTVKKAPPLNLRDDPTWARAEVVEERLDHGDTLRQIKYLNDTSKKTVGEKRAALAYNQGTQVSRILDELINKEKDHQNFAWTLAQIKKEERIIKSKSSSKKDSPKRETTIMTVYVMRAPLPHVNCKQLNELKERQLAEALQQHNRPPMNQQNQQNQQHQQPHNNQQPRPFPPPQHQQPHQPPPGPHHQGGPGGGGGSGFFPVPPQNHGPQNHGPQNHGPQNQGPQNQGPQRGKSPFRENTKSPGPGARGAGKKYHVEPLSDSETSESSYDSDSASDYEATSSISSVSESFAKHKKGRKLSHSRSVHRSKSNHREPARKHHKEYFVEDRRRSPSPRQYHRDMPAPQPTRPAHIPQMPRALPAFDPVTAAYHAGQEDLKAEYFGLDERERHVLPPRAIPRPVVIEQPQAVISYGHGRRESFAEPRYSGGPTVQRFLETRYSPPLTSPRYSEERYINPPRALRQERRDLTFERREYRPEPLPSRSEQGHFRRDPPDYPSESEFSSDRGYSPERREFRSGSDYHEREREAQDYMDRPGFERRSTEPKISPNFNRDPHPFAPLPLRRHYSPSLSSGAPGW